MPSAIAFRFAWIYALTAIAAALVGVALEELANFSTNALSIIAFLIALQLTAPAHFKRLDREATSGEMWVSALVLTATSVGVSIILVAPLFAVMPELKDLALTIVATAPGLIIGIGIFVLLLHFLAARWIYSSAYHQEMKRVRKAQENG